MNESQKSMLEGLVRDLQVATNEALMSAMVFGSAARGEHRANHSDLNLLLAFTSCSPSVLKASGPLLQRAWRSARVRPYLVGASELPRIADVFPLKLWDIKAAHVVLHGPDLLSDVTIDAEHLRIRIEQELRNELIRLRWQIVHNHDATDEMQRYFARLGHRLRTVFAGMLHLRGGAPAKATFDAVFEALPKLGLDAGALGHLRAPSGDLEVLVKAAVGVLEGAIQIVDEHDDA